MEELLEQKYKLLHQGSMLRGKCQGRKLPKIPEPQRKLTNWDYILAEMTWMASSFKEDRKHKTAAAFFIVQEIKDKQEHLQLAKQQQKSQLRLLAKNFSGLIQNHFSSYSPNATSKREIIVVPKMSWIVEEVTQRPQVNITLRYSSFNNIVTSITPQAPMNDQNRLPGFLEKKLPEILNNYGYSQPLQPKKTKSKASTPATQEHDSDSVSEYALSNFQLYYDVEDYSKLQETFKKQVEQYQVEEIEVFKPLEQEVDQYFPIWEEDDNENQINMNLLPDAEEYMLWGCTQKTISDRQDPTFFPFDNSSFSFPNNSQRKNWQLFEDMQLERYICELGGNWDLISDLMNVCPYTGDELFTAEECSYRWGYLQKRKGRILPMSFVPQPVLLSQMSNLQPVLSKFSLLKQSGVQGQLQKHQYAFEMDSSCDSVYEYVVKNPSFENNSYFYHYEEINGNSYIEQKKFQFNDSNDFDVDIERLCGESERSYKEKSSDLNLTQTLQNVAVAPGGNLSKRKVEFNVLSGLYPRGNPKTSRTDIPKTQFASMKTKGQYQTH